MPIPGTTKLNRLEENLGAATVELTVDDLREIESAAARIRVQGARYSESSEKMIDSCRRGNNQGEKRWRSGALVRGPPAGARPSGSPARYGSTPCSERPLRR